MGKSELVKELLALESKTFLDEHKQLAEFYADFIISDRKKLCQGYKDIYGVVGLIMRPNAMEESILQICEDNINSIGHE